LNYANTTKESKKILNINDVKIDGEIRRNFKFPIGIFDTIEFVNEHLRVILNKKGKIDLVKISKEEALSKPCRIIGKTMVKGKLQLNLYDGKNIFVDNGAYKVGDTVVVSLPEQKILNHLSLGREATIFLTGGKHIGEIGSVESITGDKIVYKNQKGELTETLKRYAFVIGDNKPLITIGER
jgi:small subunit ribosomal protein S4e